MSEALPAIMTLSDVLSHLQGRIGRTKLLSHLSVFPLHEGAPTHRRWGRKYIFHPDDYERLIASLECPSKSSPERDRIISTSAELSEEKAYLRALELVTPRKQKSSGPSARPSFGRKPSMAKRRS